jgi:hypothetical protein
MVIKALWNIIDAGKMPLASFGRNTLRNFGK